MLLKTTVFATTALILVASASAGHAQGIGALTNPDNAYLLGRDWGQPNPHRSAKVKITATTRHRNGKVTIKETIRPVRDVATFCRYNPQTIGC